MVDRESLTAPGVRATVQRHVTGEETVCFEGLYLGDDEARLAVANQLALCRAHMAQYNEEVRLIHDRKSQELDEQIAMKGEELKRVESQVADAHARLKTIGKRLQAAG